MEQDRDDFLQELIRLEGRRGITLCSICEKNQGIYRCDDCLATDLYCKGCLLARHASQPFHIVKVTWILADRK